MYGLRWQGTGHTVVLVGSHCLHPAHNLVTYTPACCAAGGRIYCKDNAWKNQASPELCAVVGAAKQVLLPWPVLHEVQWLQGGGSMSFDPLLHPDGGGRVMTATDIPQVMVQRHRIQIMSPGVESADIWRLRLAYPADRDPFDRQIASHAYDLLYNQDSAVFVTSDRCMQHCSMLRTLW